MMIAENAPGAVTAKPSSTIVVFREASAMPEILLVKRRAGDAFGESYTFPGGVIDDNESNATRFGSGVTEDDANQFLGIDNGGLDFYSAGIRELFEETGIFLVRNNSGAWAACNSDIAVCRNEIDRGKRDWAAFLQQYRFNMAFDALHYFAHWITPLIRPKRWTTRFFLAEIPSGQTACHDGHETTDSRWMTVGEALLEEQSGNLQLPYPTRKTLESLREISATSQIPAWAREQQRAGVTAVRPDHVARKEP